MGKSTTITHFFKRKNLNDLEASTSDATLPTTNADIPIPRNIEIPIPKNVDIHIPENVDIPIPENPQPKFQKLILVCWSGILDCVNKYEIIMLINVMKSDELTITMVFFNLVC
jgi:hypothetical protein